MTVPLDVTLVGAGMIAHDQILPSLYHLQRLGVVGELQVCARTTASLQALANDELLGRAFPDQGFRAWPGATAAETAAADAYIGAIDRMRPRQCVVIATPDHLHHDMVQAALKRDQHVICVKPLVLTATEAEALARLARERGLFVGVEYHKRFDRRALVARREYRAGAFGRFVMGDARMIEPYAYRRSGFQTWFTCAHTDPFVYVGCHYTDLTTFITGLRPTSASVAGVKGTFPNGNEGYLWSHARIGFEGGAYLSVVNGLGYPDAGAGSNDQGLTLFCEGDDGGALLSHDDQSRGVAHGQLTGKRYRHVNPDYFQYVPWSGAGLRPVGYGYDSIAALVDAVIGIERRADADDVEVRRAALAAIDDHGLLATPANSSYNERLHEAARASIRNHGQTVAVAYPDE